LIFCSASRYRDATNYKPALLADFFVSYRARQYIFGNYWKTKKLPISWKLFVACRGLKSNPEAFKFIKGIDKIFQLKALLKGEMIRDG